MARRENRAGLSKRSRKTDGLIEPEQRSDRSAAPRSTDLRRQTLATALKGRLFEASTCVETLHPDARKRAAVRVP